jgi:hypothetical protein
MNTIEILMWLEMRPLKYRLHNSFSNYIKKPSLEKFDLVLVDQHQKCIKNPGLLWPLC